MSLESSLVARECAVVLEKEHDSVEDNPLVHLGKHTIE